jgi:hypothetical protein
MSNEAIVAIFATACGMVLVVALVFANPNGCSDDCTRNGGAWIQGVGRFVCVEEMRR